MTPMGDVVHIHLADIGLMHITTSAHHYQLNQHRYTSPIKYVPFLIISDRVSTSVSSCVHPSSFFSCRDYAAYRIERFNEKVVNCCGSSNDAKSRFGWLQCNLLCTIQQYSWRFLFSANKNRGIQKGTQAMSSKRWYRM